MFVVAFFIIGQIGNNPDTHHKRVDKLTALYLYNRTLFIDKMYDLLRHAIRWMNLKNILCERRQT